MFIPSSALLELMTSRCSYKFNNSSLMFSKSRSKSVWLLPIFLLIIDLTKTNLSSNIFSLDSASCNDIVIVLKSSKESVGRKSRDSGGLVKPTFPSKSYNLILVTMHFCVTCRLCKWVQIIITLKITILSFWPFSPLSS